MYNSTAGIFARHVSQYADFGFKGCTKVAQELNSKLFEFDLGVKVEGEQGVSGALSKSPTSDPLLRSSWRFGERLFTTLSGGSEIGHVDQSLRLSTLATNLWR